MSTLVNFPLGRTLDYWNDRLLKHGDRRRFLCAKAVEFLAYRLGRPVKARSVRQGAVSPPDPLGIEPHIARNGVTKEEIPAVVVPVLLNTVGDLRRLERLTARLNAQTWPARVILVDDGSAMKVPEQESIDVVRSAARRGPAAARNLGVGSARSVGAKVVFFTDADCLPDKTWVEAGVEHFLANPFSHLLSGNTRSLDASWLGRYHEINGTLNGRSFRGSSILLYGPTCNLAASTYLLRRVPFDVSFRHAACEDIHFGFEAYLRGFLAQHVAAMGVAHDFRYDKVSFPVALSRFIRLFRKYAKSEPLLLEHLPNYYDYFDQTVEIPVTMSHEGIR